MTQAQQQKPSDILDTFHHVFVEEVVKNPKMHFFTVPRLGSYLAIPLCYKSCLFEDALDNAVADYFAVVKAREEQERQKADWEDEQARIREDKEKAGEIYEEPKKVWPAIE